MRQVLPKLSRLRMRTKTSDIEGYLILTKRSHSEVRAFVGYESSEYLTIVRASNLFLLLTVGVLIY